MFMLKNSITLLWHKILIKQLFNHVYFTLSFIVGYKTHKIEVLYRRDPLSPGNKTEGETMLLTLVTLNYAEYMCYNLTLQFLPMLSHSILGY